MKRQHFLRGAGLSALAGAMPAHADAACAAPATFRAVETVASNDGINFSGWLPIGGIRQWVSIRARHRTNPVLLFLHGGPGFTTIPVSYFYMSGWDEYFTFVQWDQRGAGKTYAGNDPDKIRPTMRIDRMLADTIELMSYLRREYSQERIILAGHSWGTVLGLTLAQKYPQWLHCYVAMGQFVDFKKSEALGYDATLSAARVAGNAAAVRELQGVAPYPDLASKERTLKALGVERRWLEYYDGDSRL